MQCINCPEGPRTISILERGDTLCLEDANGLRKIA